MFAVGAYVSSNLILAVPIKLELSEQAMTGTGATLAASSQRIILVEIAGHHEAERNNIFQITELIVHILVDMTMWSVYFRSTTSFRDMPYKSRRRGIGTGILVAPLQEAGMPSIF